MSERCFDSFNVVLSASERSSQKRNAVIYNEIQKNVQQLNIANPVKTNGFNYNKNSIFNPTCDISNGDVAVSKSYEMRADIKEGGNLIYPVNVSTPKYESWCGNLLSVDYVKYSIGNVAQIDSSTNIIIDPSFLIFSNECIENYGNLSAPEDWTRIVDLSFQTTYFARAANNPFGCERELPPAPPGTVETVRGTAPIMINNSDPANPRLYLMIGGVGSTRKLVGWNTGDTLQWLDIYGATGATGYTGYTGPTGPAANSAGPAGAIQYSSGAGGFTGDTGFMYNPLDNSQNT